MAALSFGMLKISLAGMPAAVGALEPGAGPADEAVRVAVIGVVTYAGGNTRIPAERRGGDRARGSDRGARDARCRANGAPAVSAAAPTGPR